MPVRQGHQRICVICWIKVYSKFNIEYNKYYASTKKLAMDYAFPILMDVIVNEPATGMSLKIFTISFSSFKAKA